MKLIVLIGLILSHSVFADMVYMQEDEQGKSVILNDGSSITVMNDSSNKNWAIYPDLTADAKELVYAEGPGGDDLHLTYTNRITKKVERFHSVLKGMVLHPKFTKNGKLIFFSAPGPQGKNTIYFFDRAALTQKQGPDLSDYSLSDAKALDESDEAYFPRPSSDGNFVVYQRNVAGKKEIIFFDRLENQKTVLTEGMSPALSFDEKLIAFTSKKEGNWNIYLLDRTSGKVTQMTSDKADEMAPTFMPDNTLVFASNKSGHYQLYKFQEENWVKLSSDSSKDYYSPQFSGETTFTQGLKAPFAGNPRSSFGTVTHEGKVYMAGGHQGAEHTYPPESFTDTFLVYDPAINEWKQLAPRPFKAHGYQIVAHGNYIYAFGGFTYAANYNPQWKSLDVIDRYDIKANKWETIGRLRTPRSSNAAITIQGKVYLVGGWNSTPKFNNDLEGTFLSDIEIFDFATEKVELASFKIPLPLRRAFTGINYNDKILLIGGLGVGSSHFELISNVTAINPLDGSVQELAPLPFATFAPAAEILNNELFVFGGMFKMGPMAYEYVAHVYGMKLDEQKWRHTGRYLKETKGFSQVFKLNDSTVGILGGHHYFEGYDSPVNTFETFTKP